MVKFFQAMKNPNTDPNHDVKLQEVLKGGRGDKKRHFAVDKKLYGTEEGVQKRKEAEEEVEKKQEKKKAMKKKKKVKNKRKKEDDDNHEQTEQQRQLQKDDSTSMMPTAKQATATAVGVGALALVATLMSGRKSS